MICGAALIIASVAFTIYDRANFLHAKSDDLATSAKMIGLNSTAALTFHDPRTTREILSSRANWLTFSPNFIRSTARSRNRIG